MKILLTTLNSKYIHSNPALRDLYAAAEGIRRSIELKEFTINNEDDYIFGEILRGGYGLVCFSCYIWNIEKILYLTENLKKALPQLRIALGGPEVSFDAVNLLTEHREIDFVMRGEGEESFPALIKAVQAELQAESAAPADLAELLDLTVPEQPNYHKIKGLAYRMDGKIFVNPPASPVVLETVPFPYNFLVSEPDKVLYYESSRGCPYRCSYCLSSVDRQMRAMPMERVKSDLSYFIYKQVKQVKFIDRTFNWNRDRSREIFRYLIGSDNGVTNFHFELCGDLIDEGLLRTLSGARRGLFQFEIGVQSTNAKALSACGRSSDFGRLSTNVKKLKGLGNIHLHLDLIAGLPFEDYLSFMKSFNDVYALQPDMLQLGFLKLLKGAPIREAAEEHDYCYRTKPPYEVISNKYLSALQLTALKRVEHVLDLYYNRGGFCDTLHYCTENLASSPFSFYEEFANYFYLKGFQHKSHKKEDLYRILLLYAGWKDRSGEGIRAKVRELLTWDMGVTLNPDAIKKFEKKGWDLV